MVARLRGDRATITQPNSIPYFPCLPYFPSPPKQPFPQSRDNTHVNHHETGHVIQQSDSITEYLFSVDTQSNSIVTATRLRIAAFVSMVLGLAIFPYGWVGVHYRPIGRWLDMRFNSEFAHHVGHSVVFAIVSIVLLSVFPILRRRYSLFFITILTIGCTQEALQLMYKRRLVATNDGVDVIVDLCAATTVYILVRIALAVKNRLLPAQATAQN